MDKFTHKEDQRRVHLMHPQLIVARLVNAVQVYQNMSMLIAQQWNTIQQP
jgi:hypothetical protein